MSHIVIHDDDSNVTHYAEFDDLQAAASYLEDLVNQDADSNARLFALEPVEFEVKSYVKVEIGTVTPAEPDVTRPAVEPAVVVAVEAEPETDEVFTDAPVDDTVEYVEAVMAPVDVYAADPMPERVEEIVAGESRRGLFGR